LIINELGGKKPNLLIINHLDTQKYFKKGLVV